MALSFQITAFGKLKAPGLRDTADYYQKLIRTWAVVNEVELKPQVVSEKSKELREKNQTLEARLLMDEISASLEKKGTLAILDETGPAMTTKEWANWIQDLENQGIRTLHIAIGSSLGFSEALKKQAKKKISFGPQTLSHQLIRPVLYEQIYRALSVIKGHPYHNEG